MIKIRDKTTDKEIDKIEMSSKSIEERLNQIEKS